MDFDPILLSRLQFAFTISFHILFPTLTIGLASYLAVLEGLWLKTGRREYKHHYHFWAKIFALSFGMGVVSGIVLSYEFGTNFSRFSEAAGNVIGPLMTYEVLTAFFMEAGFLGVMLFGWQRVGPKLHFFATLMVALGTMASAFWILSANSWMHTPQGSELVDGVFYPVNWFEIVFNPSFPYRLAHMLLASMLTTAFFVAGVSAWYLLRGREQDFARRSLQMAVLTAALAAPVQIVVGDLHGLNVLEHQPMKVAAMEGRWETMEGAPLLLFALPDQAEQVNHFEVGIPKLASLILTHELDGEVKGLKEVAPENQPRMSIVFWSFRVMVGIGSWMLLLSWLGVWTLRGARLYHNRWLLQAFKFSVPAGFIATLSGWYVAEVGRQPWLVNGLYRTAEGASKLPAADVLWSLISFVVVYSAIFAAFLYYLLLVIRRGPEVHDDEEPVLRPEGPAHPAFMPVEDD
ncbi:MAG: cytochrome ubiquinol oxidase subunit I [Pseudomonadota bacterium]